MTAAALDTRTRLVTQAFDLQRRLDHIARVAHDDLRRNASIPSILYAGRAQQLADRARERTQRRLRAALLEPVR